MKLTFEGDSSEFAMYLASIAAVLEVKTTERETWPAVIVTDESRKDNDKDAANRSSGT